MICGVPGLKRTLSSFFVSILLTVGLVSCGGSGSKVTTSGLPFRVFISNPLTPAITGGAFPALNIVDAGQDVLSPFDVALTGTTASAGMMVESPKRDRTVVFSPTTDTSSNNTLGIVDNAKESASGSVTLPGPTESMFVWSDNTTLFAAIPTAPVNGQPAGAVLQIDISKTSIRATIPVAGASYVVPNSTGNLILVVSETANGVTVLAPGLLGNANPSGALTPVAGSFDHPVWATFSSDASTAYVLNCGPECGGAMASVAVVDMTQTPPVVTATVPVPAATTGLLNGSTLYVAGTPPSAGNANCQANLCGVLSVLPAANISAAPATFAITDGYHNTMAMAPNNQLFIGSRTCTNVIAAGSTPSRGCLSVFNSSANTVYTAGQNGDVTGIEPITDRTVVYVCEGGALQIYDTDFDLGAGRQLQLQKTQLTITGQAIDVKMADFPNGSVIPN
jgi:hypothetical protein